MKAVFTANFLCPAAAESDVCLFITNVFSAPFKQLEKKNTIVYRGVVYHYKISYIFSVVQLQITSLEPISKCAQFLDELQEIIRHQIESALITDTSITFIPWREVTA